MTFSKPSDIQKLSSNDIPCISNLLKIRADWIKEQDHRKDFFSLIFTAALHNETTNE